MPGMPLARIYASNVDEAEPLRADLFARGYTVEIVFPDAQSVGPADLEFRLEHCSPAQAIARIEEGESHPSQCVFLTSAGNPERDLILIEMTVTSADTYSRHPILGPGDPPSTDQATAQGSTEPVALHAEEIELAQVIGLPISVAGIATTLSPAPILTDSYDKIRDSTKRNNDDDWHKLVATEVTAFLAHAPHIEARKLFPVNILNGLRSSQVAQPGRKRLGAWTLLGVASSVLLMLSLVWHTGQSRPSVNLRQAPAATTIPISAAVLSVPTPTPKQRKSVQIAQDTVVRFGNPIRKAPVLRTVPSADKSLIAGFGAERATPVQTSSVRTDPVAVRPTAIPKITDLK